MAPFVHGLLSLLGYTPSFQETAYPIPIPLSREISSPIEGGFVDGYQLTNPFTFESIGRWDREENGTRERGDRDRQRRAREVHRMQFR
jgi:hypothetical protein